MDPDIHPDGPPNDIVEQKIVSVNCGNCNAQFEFPVEPSILGFGFICTNCNAHNQVNVSQ